MLQVLEEGEKSDPWSINWLAVCSSTGTLFIQWHEWLQRNWCWNASLAPNVKMRELFPRDYGQVRNTRGGEEKWVPGTVSRRLDHWECESGALIALCTYCSPSINKVYVSWKSFWGGRLRCRFCSREDSKCVFWSNIITCSINECLRASVSSRFAEAEACKSTGARRLSFKLKTSLQNKSPSLCLIMNPCYSRGVSA